MYQAKLSKNLLLRLLNLLNFIFILKKVLLSTVKLLKQLHIFLMNGD
jgi:hypothetical protein